MPSQTLRRLAFLEAGPLAGSVPRSASVPDLPEPKGRLLPSHVVPCATRAPIVARAHPALHAHVARMTCLSQCLQHDPATRVPTVLAVSLKINKY